MAYPVYVLLPEGVEWVEVPGCDAQRPAPVRWYLRQSMPEAKTQVAVLIKGETGEVQHTMVAVAMQAEALGGITVDGHTQQILDPTSVAVETS